MYKSVSVLIPAFNVDMGGVMVKQSLPTNNIQQVDPFLLLHHAKFSFRNDAPALHQGLGPHPHKGFTPVTFVIEGEVHHRDSRGNNQVAKKGEVQWMHAGAGIVHSERPSEALVQREGEQEIIQLWINSPSSSKQKEPMYQFLSEKNIPKFASNDKLVSNKLITGQYGQTRGLVVPESEQLLIWGEANKGGEHVYEVSSSFNTMIYLVKGEIRIAGFGLVEKESLVILKDDSELIGIKATTDSQFLILAGKGLNENTVQQGPFVMNTQTEILEAMRDYQMGKMGFLVEE